MNCLVIHKSLLNCLLSCPREGLFEAPRKECYFRSVAVLFQKKKSNVNEEKMGGRTSETLYS